jgi:hypothetical protein
VVVTTVRSGGDGERSSRTRTRLKRSVTATTTPKAAITFMTQATKITRIYNL